MNENRLPREKHRPSTNRPQTYHIK